MLRTLIAAVVVLAGCGQAPAHHATNAPDAMGRSDAAGGGDRYPADATGFVPAPHRAWPQVPPRGGVVLSGMRLVWITSPDDSAGRTYYAPLFAALAAPDNPWWAAVAGEYDVQPPRAVIAARGASALTGTSLSLAQMRAYVDAAVAADPSLAPDGSTLYVLLLPRDVGAGSPCSAGGSHTSYDAAGDAWAHVTRCTASTGTDLASHEIIEAALDPSGNGYKLPFDGSTAWSYSVFAASDGEVADLCQAMGSFVDAGGVKYQRSWSNLAAAAGGAPCVPAAATPFFAVSPAMDWYSIVPGATIEIPLTGFSTAAIPDWAVSARVMSRPGQGSGSGYSISLAGDLVNNGRTIMLAVHAAADVAPGSWALVRVISDGTPASIAETYGVPVGVYAGSTP